MVRLVPPSMAATIEPAMTSTAAHRNFYGAYWCAGSRGNLSVTNNRRSPNDEISMLNTNVLAGYTTTAVHATRRRLIDIIR